MEEDSCDLTELEWSENSFEKFEKNQRLELNHENLNISKNLKFNDQAKTVTEDNTSISEKTDELITVEHNENTKTSCIKELNKSNLSSAQDGIKFQLNDPPDVTQILSCDEKNIEVTPQNVTILNVACQKILKEIEQVLLTRLKKNRKEQEIVLNLLKANDIGKTYDGLKKINLKHIYSPYFKDVDGYPPPLNEDVKNKIKCNRLLPLHFSKSPQLWTPKDSKILVASVMANCKKLSTTQDIDPETVDWMKISATSFDGKYLPSECKSMWLMNLNPQINKSTWSKNEKKELKRIAAKYKHQNWDKIAEELKTNRTGFQCCVQYQTHGSENMERWTKKEDEALINLVKKFKIKDYIPWNKVVWYFETRSLRQCQERYIYHLQNIKKGNFSIEEDYSLLYFYSKFKSFKDVAKFFPNRVPPQIRGRYEYLVRVTMPKFTEEEDKLLVQLMAKYPKDWEKISDHFQDRSKLQCRLRWTEIQKKIPLKNDDEDYEDIGNEEGDFDNSKNIINMPSHADTKNIHEKLSNEVDTKKHTREFSTEYKKLMEHCKCGFKFLFGPKPRNFFNKEERENLFLKMKITMRNLSVHNLDVFKSFNIDSLTNNCEFDEEDMIILRGLKKENLGEKQIDGVSQLFPPNLITLVGLRSLMVGGNYIKNSTVHYKNTADKNFGNAKVDNRVLFSDAKKLFKSRLKALFAFPLMLSAISQDGVEILHYPKKSKKPKPLSRLAKKLRGQRISKFRKGKRKAGEDVQDSLNDSGKNVAVTEDGPKENITKRKRGRPPKIPSEKNVKKSRMSDSET